MEIILLCVLVVLVLALFVLVLRLKPKQNDDAQILLARITELQATVAKIESNLREDFRINREENAAIARDNRIELNNTLKSITEQSQNALREINQTLQTKTDALIAKIDENNQINRKELTANLQTFGSDQKNKFDELRSQQSEMTAKMVEQIEKTTVKVEEKLAHLAAQAKNDSVQMRDSLILAFKGFQETFDKNVQSFNELQREKFAQLETKQNDMVRNTETKLEQIKVTVEEKLEKTLSERLGQSFETVGKQLIEVQKGLGEMQTLAQDVGGLKRVLSNVKMRGGIGEVQLAMLLEQILAPDQYEANVKTKAGSNDLVEFAIKLPGRDENANQVWLPVDAKFPKDVYEQLQNAYDAADLPGIELLENTIKKMAKDISDKYIDPPATTDFGIMFLPFEGIYAEVVRKASLLEELQRTYKIIVTGPTTLAAILNSLQMGFKTLAIQKRSGEVWQILGEVKKEFGNFGGLLEKAQKNISTGLTQLDDVMGKRTKAIQRKLRSVEVMGEIDSKTIIPEIGFNDSNDDENE